MAKMEKVKFLSDVQVPNITVTGDLNVSGTVVTENVDYVLTKGAVTVINSENNELAVTLMGTVIRTGTQDESGKYIDYAMVYDPTNEAVRLGVGVYDAEVNEFTFNDGEGNPIAVRDLTTQDDKAIVMWDAENHCLTASSAYCQDGYLMGDFSGSFKGNLDGAATSATLDANGSVIHETYMNSAQVDDKIDSIRLPITRSQSNNTGIVFNEGSAQGEYSIAGGTTDKEAIKDAIGKTYVDLLDKYGNVIPDSVLAALGLDMDQINKIKNPQGAVAEGLLSVAMGVNTQAVSGNSIAIGYDNVSGGKGYYFRNVDFTNKNITLSTSQTSQVDPLGSINWSIGDRIYLVNGDRYLLTITAINGNTITVENIPFESIEYTSAHDSNSILSISSTYKVSDRTVINIDKPTSGEVVLGYGAVSIGSMNRVSGNSAFSVGYKNNVFSDFGAAFGQENIVGYNGFACGINNVVKGKHSFAAGGGVCAEGEKSFAINSETQAKGKNSFAAGSGSQAVGREAVAMGKDTKALHISSFACGENSTANGQGAFAGGMYTEALGKGSASFGERSHASGYASFACGKDTVAHDKSFAAGDGAKANGVNSFAGNRYTQANGDNSVAFGNESISSGNSSFTSGAVCTASGDYSFSSGDRTKAQGQSSAAFGARSVANGNGAFACGGELLKVTAYETKTSVQMYGWKLNYGDGNSSNLWTISETPSNGQYLYFNNNGEKGTSPSDRMYIIGTISGIEGRWVYDAKSGFLDRNSSYTITRYPANDGTFTCTYYPVTTMQGVKAIGNASAAFGLLTEAREEASFVSGIGTCSTRPAQTVIGTYNKPSEDALFIVGNGTENSFRNNAFEVTSGSNLDESGIIICGVKLSARNLIRLLELLEN